jgi:large subunit ribosomal protein L9
MKVLLVSDVDKLGLLGDVVEVNTGYARNYLLPSGLAREATKGNIKSIAQEKSKRDEQRLHERKAMENAAAALAEAKVVITSKANPQGHLFGSVAGPDIAANLRSQGFAVADDNVQMAEHIKEIGTRQVTIRFAEGITAAVEVTVTAEEEQQQEAQ